MKPRERLLELDVLRGIAILLVMGVHVPAYPIWSTFGGFGVDLFFVLSGFLISNLLFTEFRNTGRIRLARFFMRRALKLYPSFYLLLGLTLAYCYFWHVPVTGRQVLGELLLTQNYIGAIWGHTWSLSVEEHFYILLPLLLTFLMSRRKGSGDPFRVMPFLFLAVAAICLALRIANAWYGPAFSHRNSYEPSHLRIDSLLFGVLLSYMHNFQPKFLLTAMSKPWRFPISLVGILGLIPALVLSWQDPVVYTIGFTTLYLSFGTMLLLSLYKEKAVKASKPGFATRAIARMGAYSYTIYLWHVPMAQVFASLAVRFPTVNMYVMHAIYFATSIAVGVLASKLVELPILKLRDRVFAVSAADGEPRPLYSPKSAIPETELQPARELGTP